MNSCKTLVTRDHFKKKHFRSIYEWRMWLFLYPQWVAPWATIIAAPQWVKIKVQLV